MDVRRLAGAGSALRGSSAPALGLTGDGALRAAIAADREVTRMESVRMDHLAEYLAGAASSWEPPIVQVPGVEDLIRLGGPGTPLVPEFAVCEVAAGLAISQPAATSLCSDVLDLTHRLPRVAQAVRSGDLPFAKARVIARRTRDLALAAVGVVENRVMTSRSTARGPVPVATLVPMGKLQTMVDQAVLSARGDEEAAEVQTRVAESLYVQMVRTEHGATDIAARLASGDAVRLDRRLDQLAARLAQMGDVRSVQVRRAVALALLADPAMLRALQKAPVVDPTVVVPDVPDASAPTDLDRLPVAAAPEDALSEVEAPQVDPTASGPDVDGPREHVLPWAGPPEDDPPDTGPPEGDPDDARLVAMGVAGLPPGALELIGGAVSTVLYVHLDAATNTWCEERAGALSAAQARDLVGHSQVTVRPVLDLRQNLTYTGYQAPPLLREQLAMLNGGRCTFPACSRRARTGDVDHEQPFPRGLVDPVERRTRPQGPGDSDGMTETANTHLLCRKHHRAKTHGGWAVCSPSIGIWVWTSPAGARWLVTHGTTTSLDPDPADHCCGPSLEDVTRAFSEVS